MREIVAELSGVSFAYGPGSPVLDKVDLVLLRGDYLAVLGPNGGGKSTLLKLLLGMLAPTAGLVRVFGGPPARARGRTGYMPQLLKPRMDFPVAVLDAVLMGLAGQTARGFRFSAEEKERARGALARVGLSGLEGRRLAELSGGQQQRAFIARALVSSPEMLLLDEPTASVDAGGRTALFELLAELNRDMTIVCVSHDLSVVGCGVKSVACVNRSVHFHDAPEVDADMLRMMYGAEGGRCPVELIAHGRIPHRVAAERE
ncbi:MAG: ATP-binding cassette domain-containing protein [Thermodesulfobacteriota bacterium]